jgi:hypothetical protein
MGTEHSQGQQAANDRKSKEKTDSPKEKPKGDKPQGAKPKEEIQKRGSNEERASIFSCGPGKGKSDSDIRKLGKSPITRHLILIIDKRKRKTEKDYDQIMQDAMMKRGLAEQTSKDGSG